MVAAAGGGDILSVLLVSSIDPDEPNVDWVSLAATVYCATGQYFLPHELEMWYFKHLRENGGYASAKEKASLLLATDKRLRMASPLLRLPDAADAIKKEDDDDEKIVVSNVSRSGDTTTSKLQKLQDLSVSHLLDILQLFRAVEGFDVFEEPVGSRVVNPVISNNYGAVIRQPMSISLIRSHIAEGLIRSPQALERAIWKMAANCVFFNVPEGPYPGLARRFASACSSIIERECAAARR